MTLRIGFDMDGVLADLASAYRDVEARLFGPEEVEADVPESPDEVATVRKKPDTTEDAKVRLTASAKVLIPPGLDRRLRKAAERARVSKGEFVRRAIERALAEIGAGRV